MKRKFWIILLVIVVAILALISQLGHRPKLQVSFNNRSGSLLNNVVISGDGFHQKFDTIQPGERRHLEGVVLNGMLLHVTAENPSGLKVQQDIAPKACFFVDIEILPDFSLTTSTQEKCIQPF